VSPLEAVSVMISEYAASRFSLTLYVSTGAVCDDESMRQVWKTFSVTISKRAATLYSLTVSESTRAVCADESMGHL
jgi:hypothetical protein